MFSRKVLHDEMLLSLIDYTEGTQISAVLKDGSVYTGDIYQIEEKGDASWISVDNYRLIMSDGSIIEDEDLGAHTLMMFKLSDVERIHLVYPEKSRFAKEIKERKTEHN